MNIHQAVAYLAYKKIDTLRTIDKSKMDEDTKAYVNAFLDNLFADMIEDLKRTW